MKKQNISKLIIVLIASVLLQSCFVAKDYKTPEVKTTDLYRTDKALDSTTIASISWDKLFTDTYLNEYIKEGLTNNYDVQIALESLKIDTVTNKKASAPNEIGVPLQGKLSEVLVKVGDVVQKNTPLFVIEAMKMESTVVAPFAGKVSAVELKGGSMVMQDDLVVVLELS